MEEVTMTESPEGSRQNVYQIRVQGHLDQKWSGWFDSLTITPQEEGETLLVGPIADQAALHGLLAKIRDLGTPLISVQICSSEGGKER
jgi:hypothetical protein